jgi:hypothetical protein
MPSRRDGKPMARPNGKAANCGWQPAQALLVGTGRRNGIRIALDAMRWNGRGQGRV